MPIEHVFARIFHNANQEFFEQAFLLIKDENENENLLPRKLYSYNRTFNFEIFFYSRGIDC